MRFTASPVALAFGGVLALGGVHARPAAADDWNHSYPLTGKAVVHLDTADGNVTIESWDQREVQVEIEAPGWHIGPHGLHISDESAGNRVDVRVREPAIEFHFGLTSRTIRVKVHVPRECDLQLKTSDGNVTLGPVAGHIDVVTSDGDILAEGLTGDISLRTSDGGIDASGLQGRLQASSSDGNLQVQGRFDDLSLKTSDGTIVAETENGSKIGDGWNIETRDGNVVTRIGSDLCAQLDARSLDGHVTVELPIRVTRIVDHGSMTGDLNGGGPPLRIRTSDGSIRVEKL